MRRALLIVLILMSVLVLLGIGAVVTLGTPTRPDAVATLSKDAAAPQGGDRDLEPLDRALGLLDDNDPESAKAVIEPYLESNPSDADAIVLLGRCYLALGDAPQASALIKQAVGAHPDHADYRYWYGSSLGTEAMGASTLQQMSLGMSAIAQYKKAVELDPDHLGARQGLMFAAMMAPPFVAGGLDGAKAQAQEIARIDDREGKIAHAQIAMREERHDDAIALLDEAFAMSDDEPDPRLLVQFVRALYDAGQTERAFEEARRVVAMGDRGVEGLYQLGRLCAKTGEHPEEGLDALTRYLEHTGTEIPPAYIHWRIAQIQIHLDRIPDARASLETALELMPGMPEAKAELAALDPRDP
jgi:tetratricopeptide (TPR) repeat protein